VKTRVDDPESRPATPNCQLCGSPRVSARVTRGVQVFAVCNACLGKALAGTANSAPDDVARFFSLLTNPHPSRKTVELPVMAAETTCPRCGLTYEEFADVGRAGCGQCYATFSAAIAPALDALNAA
jgi:protein arginine kinase activator